MKKTSRVRRADNPRAEHAGAAQALAASMLLRPAKPEVTMSAALTLTALPGDGGIRSRSVAILLADGVDGESIAAVRATLRAALGKYCHTEREAGAPAS